MFLEYSNRQGEQRGWIEVITGCMFAGKTEELIRRLKRAKFARQTVKIFKSAMDDRFSQEEVVSHDANTIRSIPVDHPENILLLANNVKVVGIDEAQFFDIDIVNTCNALAYNGVRVIVAGLDMDYRGNPFGPMPALMSCAEYVTKVHAICVHCGNLAHYSFRIAKNDNLVMLGNEDIYEPLCRKCYLEAYKENKN